MIQGEQDAWRCLTCVAQGKLFRPNISSTASTDAKVDPTDIGSTHTPVEPIDPTDPTPSAFNIRFAPNYFHIDNGKKKRQKQRLRFEASDGIDLRKASQLLNNRHLPGALFLLPPGPISISNSNNSTENKEGRRGRKFGITSKKEEDMTRERGLLCVSAECSQCAIYPILEPAFQRISLTDSKEETDNKGDHLTLCLRCFLSHLSEMKSTPPVGRSTTPQAGRDYVKRFQWKALFAWLPSSRYPLYPSLAEMAISGPEVATTANAAAATATAAAAAAASHTAAADSKVSNVAPPHGNDTGEYAKCILKAANGIFGRLWDEKEVSRASLIYDPRWSNAVLDLALASYDFGHSLQDLDHGIQLLARLDDAGMFEGSCLAHLWKEPRPPNRQIIPFKPPSTQDGRMPPAVALFPDFNVTMPLWSLVGDGSSFSSNALAPDIVLAGLWPIDRPGDLDFTDPRMFQVAAAQEEQCEHEEPDRKTTTTRPRPPPPSLTPSLKRSCGCSPPQCWPMSAAMSDLWSSTPSERIFLPRNWMPQTLHLVAQLWDIISWHAHQLLAWPQTQPNKASFPPLKVLMVLLEPEDTVRLPFFGIKDTFFPPIPASRPVAEQLAQRSVALQSALDHIPAMPPPESYTMPPDHHNDAWSVRYPKSVQVSKNSFSASGRVELILGHDRGKSVSRQFQPYPYGMYALQDSTLTLAVDPTAEIQNKNPLTELLHNPIVEFLCQWVVTIIKTRFSTLLSSEQLLQLVQRVAHHSTTQVKDDRLKLVLHLVAWQTQQQAPASHPPPSVQHSEVHLEQKQEPNSAVKDAKTTDNETDETEDVDLLQSDAEKILETAEWMAEHIRLHNETAVAGPLFADKAVHSDDLFSVSPASSSSPALNPSSSTTVTLPRHDDDDADLTPTNDVLSSNVLSAEMIEALLQDDDEMDAERDDFNNDYDKDADQEDEKEEDEEDSEDLDDYVWVDSTTTRISLLNALVPDKNQNQAPRLAILTVVMLLFLAGWVVMMVGECKQDFSHPFDWDTPFPFFQP